MKTLADAAWFALLLGTILFAFGVFDSAYGGDIWIDLNEPLPEFPESFDDELIIPDERPWLLNPETGDQLIQLDDDLWMELNQ